MVRPTRARPIAAASYIDAFKNYSDKNLSRPNLKRKSLPNLYKNYFKKKILINIASLSEVNQAKLVWKVSLDAVSILEPIKIAL